MKNEPRAPVIFISHHSSQAALARQLKDKLMRAGVQGWMAPDDIDPGLSFDQAIIEQVARSDGIALLFCGNSDQSRHVKRELILGEDSGKPIYPVRLENVMPKGLAYWLQDYQWIDWLGGRGAGADRLVETIRRNASGGMSTRTAALAEAAAVSPRRGRRRLLIVGLAAALVATLIAGYFLLRWTPEATGAAQPDFVINPGRWTSRRDVIEIVYPQVEPQMARQMEQMFENDPDPEECIAPEVARAPGVGLFDPGGAGRCTLTSFSMSGGRMSGYLSCPLPGVTDGSVMQVTFRGRYTRTSIDLENDITISRPGNITRLRARDTTRYVGPACSRPRPA
jgi:hypothetical protein